jgi:predicted outer membrane protein
MRRSGNVRHEFRSPKPVNMKNKLIITACLIAFSASVASFAGAGPAMHVEGNMPGEKDGKFLSDALASNMYTLMLLKLSMQKATNGGLKKAAMEMMPFHQKLDAQLTAQANKTSVGIDAEERAKYNDKFVKWQSKTSGAEFDKDMVEELVDLHKDGIDMMEDAATDVSDASFKELLTVSVATMRSHLDMLVPLKGAVDDGKGTWNNGDKDIEKAMSKDAKFTSDILGANGYLMHLMQLTLKKGGNRDLKNAVQQMMEDHQKEDVKITKYASTKGMGIQAGEKAKYDAKIAKWDAKRGQMEWDADIVEELVDLHKDGIDMLEDARTDVTDQELKALIEEELAMLKIHQGLIAPLKEKVKKPWKEQK